MGRGRDGIFKASKLLNFRKWLKTQETSMDAMRDKMQIAACILFLTLVCLHFSFLIVEAVILL